MPSKSTRALRRSQAIYTGPNSGIRLAYEPTPLHDPHSPLTRLVVHRVTRRCVKQALNCCLYLEAGRRTHERGVEDEQWEATGVHCSTNERRADEASRDVEAWLKCRYMREHLGEEFGGTVSAVTSFGLFVTLDGLYVEGLIHITELGGEYFRFDEVRQELRGERSGVRYVIGSRVRVQVSRVDLDGRKIDFRMVHEGEEGALLARAKRDKAGGEKATGAVAELAHVRETDRAVKAATKARRALPRQEERGHPVRAAESPHGSHRKTLADADAQKGRAACMASMRSAARRAVVAQVGGVAVKPG